MHFRGLKDFKTQMAYSFKNRVSVLNVHLAIWVFFKGISPNGCVSINQ